MVFEKIPTFLITGVLVIIFVCLKRHARGVRLTLWTVGWTLVFTHFLAQLLEPDHGRANSLLLALDAGSLQAAVVTFLVSVSSVAENYANRTLLALVLGVPSLTYVACASFSVQARWPYILCLLACFGGAVCVALRVRVKLSSNMAAVAFLCSLAVAWAIGSALHGSFQEGTTAFLGIGFGLAGVFIFRNQYRVSPAMLTIAAGFVSWGSAFPIRFLINHVAPNLIVSGELWNTPKIFVAFGMILAVVEDKSESIAGMQHKAERLDRRLELLLGHHFPAVERCGAWKPFAPQSLRRSLRSALSVLRWCNSKMADGRLRVAGSSGLSVESLRNLRAQTRRLDARSH